MTLEKLLVFGFALGVFAALAVSATTLMNDRSDSNSKYQERIQSTVDKAAE